MRVSRHPDNVVFESVNKLVKAPRRSIASTMLCSVFVTGSMINDSTDYLSVLCAPSETLTLSCRR
jgi:hypothetical protein